MNGVDKASDEWKVVEWNEWKNEAGTKNDRKNF